MRQAYVVAGHLAEPPIQPQRVKAWVWVLVKHEKLVNQVLAMPVARRALMHHHAVFIFLTCAHLPSFVLR
jgi:hypothetical protein